MTTQQSPFLSTAEVFPEDQSQFLIKMTSIYTDIAQSVNNKEIALYQQNEQLITGQQFSVPGNNETKKYTFRKVFYIGAIGTGASLSFAHNIAGLVQFTMMYGTCITNIVDFRPIPYPPTPPGSDEITLKSTSTTVTVSNGASAPPITSGIIVLEYLLN